MDATQIFSEAIKTHPCFGLEFLGQCGYNPQNPTVYFSIGQLLTLIIITLTVYQISNPIIQLRIHSNTLFKTKFKFLGFISIFGIFFSSIIPSIMGFYKIPIIGQPLFWEILSGALFLYLSISLIKKMTTPVQLNKHNTEGIFNCVSKIIDLGKEEELRTLARELTHSLERILFIDNKDEYFKSVVKTLGRKKHAPHKNPISLNGNNHFLKKNKIFKKQLKIDAFSDLHFKIIVFVFHRGPCRKVD